MSLSSSYRALRRKKRCIGLSFRCYSGLAAEWGELLALTSEDIDFESGMVNIFKTYYRRNQTDYITSPKTESSNRKITIPKFLQEKLKNFLDRQYGLALEKRIFPITDRAIQKKMKLAKLKLIRVHDLRHSHIALLIEKGDAASCNCTASGT